MQWKPRIDYLIDLQRPVVRHRQWRFAILEVNRKPCGKPIPFTTLRETMRRVRALYHQGLGRAPGGAASGILEGNGAAKAVLLLLEHLKPVMAGSVSGIVELHCPEEGCGRLLDKVNRDTPADPVLPTRHKGRLVGSLVSLPPMRVALQEWSDPFGWVHQLFERLTQSAGHFTVHTQCARCGIRAAWDIPQKTSWARYRRTA